MSISIEKIAIIAIAVIVLLIIAPTTISLITKSSNWFLGLGLGSDSKQSQEKVLGVFSNLKNTLNNCLSKQNLDCFCTNEKILFPTDYRLEIYNDNVAMVINLLDDKEQRLDSLNLPTEGCNLIKKNQNNILDDKLYVIYGKKNLINYKRENFVFTLENVFYKKNNQLCIVEKAMLDKVNKDSLC